MPPIGAKRKRNVFESSDDEQTMGKQALPVADLPTNFDGVPADGAQYLFTVRRDYRLLPHITRAPNPHAEDPEQTPSHAGTTHTLRAELPSEKWRATIEQRFKNFKNNLNQPTIHVSRPLEANLMPEKHDRDSWWAFLAGKSEAEWNALKKTKDAKNKRSYGRGMHAFSEDIVHEEEGGHIEIWSVGEEGEVECLINSDFDNQHSLLDGKRPISGEDTEPVPVEDSQKPREPTPSLLQYIDSRMSLHLLMYFTQWINHRLRQGDPSELTETHARWIFALLSRVEDFISADDTSLLRNLARACLLLLKHLVRQRVASRGINELQQLAQGEDTRGCMGERSCWIIVSVIVGVWAQRDLWMDAEATLSELGA